MIEPRDQPRAREAMSVRLRSRGLILLIQQRAPRISSENDGARGYGSVQTNWL